jgi:hypothetical protein
MPKRPNAAAGNLLIFAGHEGDQRPQLRHDHAFRFFEVKQRWKGQPRRRVAQRLCQKWDARGGRRRDDDLNPPFAQGAHQVLRSRHCRSQSPRRRGPFFTKASPAHLFANESLEEITRKRPGTLLGKFRLIAASGSSMLSRRINSRPKFQSVYLTMREVSGRPVPSVMNQNSVLVKEAGRQLLERQRECAASGI